MQPEACFWIFVGGVVIFLMFIIIDTQKKTKKQLTEQLLKVLYNSRSSFVSESALRKSLHGIRSDLFQSICEDMTRKNFIESQYVANHPDLTSLSGGHMRYKITEIGISEIK